jgi:hypothetical protein
MAIEEEIIAANLDLDIDQEDEVGISITFPPHL